MRLLAAALLFPATLAAQSTAVLTGSVRAQSGAPVAHAHSALEREELGSVNGQALRGDLGVHRGTGSETSRSGCVAMRT